MSYAEFFAGDLAAASFLEGEAVLWSPVGDRVEPLEFSERDRVDLLNNTSPTLDSYRYRLRAVEGYLGTGPRDILEILPVPTEDLFATAYYLPQLTLQEVESDVTYQGIKGIAEEWLILDVLIGLKAKTDDQVAVWLQRKAEIEAQLRAQATDRDAAQPARIRQVWHRTDAGRPMDAPWDRRRYPWRGR